MAIFFNAYSGFLKSKSGVVVRGPGQPGSQILLAHQKYWLPITNRTLMNSTANHLECILWFHQGC
jgi:hypothetical protein